MCLQINNFFLQTRMHQYGTKIFIQQLKVPEEQNSNALYKQLNNIINSLGKGRSNQDSTQSTQDNFKFIINVLSQNKIPSIANLIKLSQIMVNQRQQFSKLIIKVNKLPELISRAILRSIKQFYQQQLTIPEDNCRQFFKAIVSHQVILKDMNAYQLFLSLTQIQLLQILKKGHEDILNYFQKFVNRLSLIQKYAKNVKQQFKTIRHLLRLGSYLLSWFVIQFVPKNFNQFVRNVSFQKIKRSIPIFLPENTNQNKYFKILVDYGLVDPQYRYEILLTIIDLFAKELQSQYIFKIFKSALELMNKRIFSQQYENKILQTVDIIRESYLKPANKEIYNKFINQLLQKKSMQFLLTHKRVILKMAVNEQTEINLFSLYYNILSNKNCDYQIANHLIEWNIKDNLIPAEQFVEKLVKAGFNRISPSNQKLIYVNSSIAWNPFITRLIQSKFKHFSQGKIKIQSLILPDYFEKNTQIYYLYTKGLIFVLTGVDCQKFKINSSLITINQNPENIRKIKQYVLMMLQKAITHKVTKLKVITNLCILISIVEILKAFQISNKLYMDFFMQTITQFKSTQIVEFFKCLKGLFKIFKNAFTLYLILFSGLQSFKLKSQNTKQAFLRVLQKVNKIIHSQPFGKINCYHSQNLKLALLVSHLVGDEGRKKALQLIVSWAALYNSFDIQVILYQFDIRFYQNFIPYISKNTHQEDKSSALCELDPQHQVNKYVFKTLQVIQLLMKTASCQRSHYLLHTNNCINFIPIRHSNQKNNINIQFKALINSKLCCNSTIQIYGSHGNQSDSNLQKHRIIFKHNKIVFYNRSQKKIEGGFQDIQDQVYARPISFSLEISNGKIVIQVNKKQLVSKAYQFMVDSIRFDLQGDVLIKQFKWQKIQQQARLLQFNSSFQIYPNEAEIKINRIAHFQIVNFQDKLNFSYLCTYLKQIIKTNYKSIDLNKFYESCCSLILVKQVGWKNQFTLPQFTYMKRLFRTILICSQNSQFIQIPNFLFTEVIQNLSGKKFYQFLIASLFNQKFLNQSTKECKVKLLKYLQNLLFDKKIGFGFAIQNRKTIIFTSIVKLLLKIDGQIRDQYCQLLKSIIFTHQANEILLNKISIIFSVAYTSNSEYMRGFLNFIFDKIISALCVVQTQQNYHLKILGKFLMSQYKSLQFIFLIIDIQTKLKMLDNMIDDQQLGTKCFSLFKDLPQQQRLKLSDRIIIYAKKGIFDYFEAKRQKKRNLENLIFFLKQICMVIVITSEQNIKQVIISILSDFMKKSAKLLNEGIKDQVAQQIQSFYYQPNFVKLLASKLQNISIDEFVCQMKESFVHCYFNNLLMKMPKLVIMKALQQLFKSAQNPVDCCIYLLKQQYILILPERSLSAFLQYIIEIIILAQEENKQAKLQQLGRLVNDYLQKLMKNYHNVSMISKPLLYCYPKMEKCIDFTKKTSLQNIIMNVTQTKFYQLKGGIFFKIICIVFHLFEIFKTEDLSIYINYFLEKVHMEKTKKKDYQAIVRVTNDFIQVTRQVKNRSPVDLAVKQVQKEHLNYFQQYDEQIIITSNLLLKPYSSKTSSDGDTDLTPFFVDFFFMKLFMYLQNHCKKSAPQQQLNVCKKYSKQCLSCIKSFQLILDEIGQNNADSIIDFQTVQDLLKVIQKCDDLLASDRKDSPEITYARISRQASLRNLGFAQISNNNQNENNFLATPSKKKIKKRGSLNIQLTSGKKKRKQLFNNLEADAFIWSQEAKQKRFHRFLREQSKQILFNELLHKLYVVNFSKQTEILNQIPKGRKIMQFINEQQQKILQQEQNLVEQYKELLKYEIRRVYRFTSKSVPQMKLKKNKFPNLTSPFVVQKESLNIKKQQKSQLSALSPELISTLLNVSNEQQKLNEINFDTIVYLNKENQNKIYQQQEDYYCQISYPKGVYFCQWNISNNQIIFTTKAQKQAKSKIHQRIIKYGSPVCNILTIEGRRIQIKVSDIYQIFYRKYNQVKNNSLQFFLTNGFSLLVVFYTQQKTKSFIKKFKNKFPQMKNIRIVQNFVKQFQTQNYTQKWVSGEISNFDYLMLINKYSGRTSCDLNQYYVFPWVLDDYTSNSIDISNPKIYRDLKKPVGALRQEKLQKYLEKLEKTSKANDQYLYGSHYSTSLFVYYYLVRLQPFSSLHKDMQGGQFDAPDRLFSSINQMWECLMSQSATSDIKQAIPQFYYFPTFLKNINNLKLGMKQSGLQVNNVQLPKWANSPADFILKMRAYLQSDYVSSNLNYWIDLIFGKDQKSHQKYNVFHPLSYVQNIRPDQIQLQSLDAIMSQITFFGQNPYVLFNKQHPRKKTRVNPITAGNISIYASLQLPLSSKQNSNLPTKIYEQQNLEFIYYVSQMTFKNKNTITLKISGIAKGALVSSVDLDMQNTTIHSLIRTIQKREQTTLKNLLSQNSSIYLAQQKMTVSYEINQHEIKFNIGYKQQKQLVNSIKLQYNFQNIKYNEIVFVVYGSVGLRVYDWNHDLVFEFSNDFGQISDCFLEYSTLFFLTSWGKLFVYDFVSNKKQLIFEYQKLNYNTTMLVYPESKTISKKNQNYYKFLIVGDKRKIILVHYTHKIGK